MERNRKQSQHLKARGAKVRIKVIGIGDAGCSSAETLAAIFSSAGTYEGAKLLYRPDLASKNLSFAAVNTDALSLEKCALNDTLQLGIKLTHGLSAGGDPQVGRVAGQQSVEDLRELVKNAELVVVLAGLGGGTGTGVAPLISRLARDQGACAVAAVEMPFDFEGQKRRQHAMEGYEALRSESDAVISIAKDKFFQSVDGHTGVLEAFRRAKELQAQAVSGLLSVTSGTVVKLEFAALKAALKKSRLHTAFGYGIGKGEKKHSQAVESLLVNPLLDKGRLLENADEMIVSVVGGHWLVEEDVQEVMAQMGRRLSGRAHVIFAADATESEADEIAVSVIASSGSWRAVSARFVGRGMTLGEAAPRAVTHAPAGTVAGVESQSKEDAVEIETQPASAAESSSSDTETSSAGNVVRINAGSTGTVGTPQPIDRAPIGQKLVAGMRKVVGALAESDSNSAHENRRASVVPTTKKLEQTQLPLELETKGRFNKVEPTILNGEDLDIPTFLRCGIRL